MVSLVILNQNYYNPSRLKRTKNDVLSLIPTNDLIFFTKPSAKKWSSKFFTVFKQKFVINNENKQVVLGYKNFSQKFRKKLKEIFVSLKIE